MATTDVIDVADAQLAINAPTLSTDQSDQLALMVSAVSELLDNLCGPIVIRTVTEIIYSSSTIARLSQWPISSITEVIDAGSTLTAETPSASGGFVAQNGLLTRRSGGSTTYWTGPITATYEAGRYASTAAVGARFKLAAQEIIAREWPQYASAWSRGGDVFGAPEAGIGYFKSVEPVVSQWLADDRLSTGVA